MRSFLLTLIFMPDPLRVSLTEVDRRWTYIRSGKVNTAHPCLCTPVPGTGTG